MRFLLRIGSRLTPSSSPLGASFSLSLDCSVLNTLAATLLYHSVTFHLNALAGQQRNARFEYAPLLRCLRPSLSAEYLQLPALWLAAKIANRVGLVKTLALTQMTARLSLYSCCFHTRGGLSVLFLTLYSRSERDERSTACLIHNGRSRPGGEGCRGVALSFWV